VRFDVLTLFPEMVAGPLGASIIGRAHASGGVQLALHQIRDHGIGRHQTVDDTPYGGGSGMVMRCDVVASAVRSVRATALAEGRVPGPVVLFEPSGHRFDQRMAERFATLESLTLVCGHYEGVDHRVGDGAERGGGTAFAAGAERFLAQHDAEFARLGCRHRRHVRGEHFAAVAANAFGTREFRLGCRYVWKSFAAAPLAKPQRLGALLLAPVDACFGTSLIAGAASALNRP
jgi:hypothetical protein